MLESVQREEDLLRPALLAQAEDPTWLARWREVPGRTMEGLARYLERAAAAGALPPGRAEDRAQALLGMLLMFGIWAPRW